MRLKSLVFAAIFALTSCGEGVTTYTDVLHNEIIGQTYADEDNEVFFVTNELLIWTISKYRDEPISYTIPYTFADNAVSFTLEDSISAYAASDDYTTMTYLNDSFHGAFESKRYLIADKIIHNYAIYKNDTFIIGDGSTEQTNVRLSRK